MDDSGGTAKPILTSLSHFRESVESGNIDEGSDVLPPELLYEEEEISASMRAQRDISYEQISPLISSEDFLYKYACSGRSTLVVAHAEKLKIRPLVLYRSLRKYWKYGQVKNALLKFTNNCGGRGKEKSASSLQRGRPIDTLHDVNPTDVLQRVSGHPASDVAALTPRLWKQRFADNPIWSPLDLKLNNAAE